MNRNTRSKYKNDPSRRLGRLFFVVDQIAIDDPNRCRPNGLPPVYRIHDMFATIYLP